MIVSRIQEQIALYAEWLAAEKNHPMLHCWESQLQFQAHWNPEARDPVAMFDEALHNTTSRRLWQTEKWRPKEIMSLFWQHDPMMVRAMFDDLFNETKVVEARISRFQFGLDALLSEYKRTHSTTVENNHYHDDYRMIALYLAFRYPDQYAAPYDFELFYNTLAYLGARELPTADDLGRFFKVQRTLMTFIEKEPKIAAAMARHIHPKQHFTGRSLLLAADFTRFIGVHHT